MIVLSVIIPVYNVERFLPDCLNSVVKCALKDMEIILVDDGSTDSSGEICEQYALRDKRITVYHKKNGGLSSARNYGIVRAHGKYLGFVDSDDIINDQMYPAMLKSAKENMADIVTCGILNFSEDINETFVCVQSKDVIISEGKECLKIIIDPNGMGDYAVNKIYKNYIFKGISYPEGRIFEDVFTSYKLFARANKVVCLDKNYYYYRMRKSSISHSKRFNPKMIDIVYSTKEQLEFFKSNAPEYLTFAYQKHLDANIIEFKHIYETGHFFKQKKLVSEIRQNIISLIESNFEISRFKKESIAIKKGKLYWLLCNNTTILYNKLHTHPRLQNILYKILNRIIFL